jgi:protein required for attachment to host cells
MERTPSPPLSLVSDREQDFDKAIREERDRLAARHDYRPANDRYEPESLAHENADALGAAVLGGAFLAGLVLGALLMAAAGLFIDAVRLALTAVLS